MKKTALILIAILGAPFAAAHQGEISAEEWAAENQKWHAETAAHYPLVHAVWHGDLAEIKRLLDGGADPNEKNETGAPPLGIAIAKKHTDIATAERHVEIVKMLLAAGADPNIDWRGWLPLHISALRGNTEFVKVLLAAGADPTLRDNTDTTAVMYACLKDIPDFMSGDGVEMGKIVVDGSDTGWGGYILACVEVMTWGMLKYQLATGAGDFSDSPRFGR